jgi:hypothetical protein
MPYDPRMLQMTRMGIGMMGPQQSNPFADARNQPPRQKQWWEQSMPGAGGQQPDDSQSASQSANSPKQPPSLLDMMMSLGKMTRPQYDKAIQGGGAGGIAPGAAAQVSPWAFLGGMGLPGGAGWGGGSSNLLSNPNLYT